MYFDNDTSTLERYLNQYPFNKNALIFFFTFAPILGEEGVVPTSIGEVMNSLVKSVHTENTHVVLESEAMVGYLVSDDPVLKSVGKQVFNYSMCLQQKLQLKIFILQFYPLFHASKQKLR